MVDKIEYLIIILFIIGLTYGFVKQLHHTMTIKKMVRYKYKRLLIGNYLSSVTLFGFIISFILNVLVALQIIQTNSITSDTTGFGCTLFLLGFFIAEFLVIPKRKVNEDLS